jgi:hypothetical protein
MAKRKNRIRQNTRQVLIAKPHKPEHDTDERTNLWITNQCLSGIADYIPIPSRGAAVARNTAIEMFLNEPRYKDKTHLLFVDADTCPVSENALAKLLLDGKPAVSGITPICVETNNNGEMTWDLLWSCTYKDQDGVVKDYGIDDLPKKMFKAYRTGGSFFLIRRDVLEKLEQPYQKDIFDEKWLRRDLGQDYYFCDNITKAGFDIWIDPEVICHHYHKFDLLEIFMMFSQNRLREAANTRSADASREVAEDV